MVVEVVSNGNGGLDQNLIFSRDLHEWEILLVGNLMKGLHLVFLNLVEEDNRIWPPYHNEIFSSKSSFSILTKPLSLICNVLFSWFWKTIFKAFSSISFPGKQNTIEVIQRKKAFLEYFPFYVSLV